MLKKFTYFLFFVLLSCKMFPTHIVGGEIYYDYLGGNQYKVTMKVYRDCINGQAPLDNPAFITIFDASGNVYTTLTVPLLSSSYVPPSINNPCIQAPNNICVQEGIYQFTTTLPPKIGGYYIVYQRCCRNYSILNLIQPGAVGTTYWEHIPGPEVAAVNSSPRFNKLPPIYICNGLPIQFDHSATDPDGDQLVYSLCAPYTGLDACCPIVPTSPQSSSFCSSLPPSCPSVNTPPPFTNVPFASPYSGSYPMSSSPATSINNFSGYLNGVPNTNGQWVVGVCVQEYRGGQLIGTHYRDFQFNVVTCSVTVVSAIQDQTQLCSGYTVNFHNLSVGGSSYFWNFGDNTTLADTSIQINPTYVYPDTGRYQVTLIANPGKPCADTSVKTFYVYPYFNPHFTPPAGQCITNNSFTFNVTGNYANYTTFQWNFSSAASPSVANTPSVSGVNYSTAGQFPVSVIVTQQPCKDTLSGIVVVYPKPVADVALTSSVVCVNSPITFSINSNNTFTTALYNWEFSNGYTTTQPSPVISFSTAGVYSYSANIITTVFCADTIHIAAINSITVNPLPIANFGFLPTSTTIFDPQIYFYDSSYAAVQWFWDFGDGATSDWAYPEHIYDNYGNYTVTQVVTNQFGCKDTTKKIVKILPEFRFWVPNCFTPGNKDNLNDTFKPFVIGVEDYQFDIFNRWGEKIFSTNNIHTGWDGTFREAPSPQDVYVWVITFKNVLSKRAEYHTGHVTLLK